MRTVIAVPCMDTMPVHFVQSLLFMEKPDDCRCVLATGSLVYDSRNELLARAKDAEADRILFVDSDMQFERDLLPRLNADIDAGCEIVAPLCFKRKPPFTPVIYSEMCLKEENGKKFPTAAIMHDYPPADLFPVEAVGFGCVLMTMDAVQTVMDRFGLWPFMPAAGFGEDMSFCMRAREAGVQIWCDSRIRVGHVGYYTYGEFDYLKHKEGKPDAHRG